MRKLFLALIDAVADMLQMTAAPKLPPSPPNRQLSQPSELKPPPRLDPQPMFFGLPAGDEMGALWCPACDEPWPDVPFFREMCPTCRGKTAYHVAKKPLTEAEVRARIPWPSQGEPAKLAEHVKDLNADLAKLQAHALTRGCTWIDLIDLRDEHVPPPSEEAA